MIQIQLLLLTALLLQTPAGGPSLDSTSPKERTAAVEELSRPGFFEGIPPLTAALKKEPKSEIRAEILAGLVRIGGRDIPPILTMSLSSDLDKDVRLQAVESIQRLYIPIADTGTIQTLYGRVKGVFAGSERPTLPAGVVVDKISKEALATAMQKDTSVEVRSAAARALGTLMAKDYVPVMVATLEDPQNRDHKTVRLEIIGSLGVLRDSAAGPSLQKTLRDADSGIVSASIDAVGLIGFQPARPQLEEIFRTNSHQDLKDQALQSLAMLHDPESKPFFEPLLDHKNDFYREKAAEGLARINYDAASLEVNLKTEKKPNVRNAMTYALVASNHDDYINELAGALNTKLAGQAEVYLYELGKYKGKVTLLNGYLRSSDPKVRAGMARVLGRIGDPSSRAPLEELTKDPNTDVLREGVNALRQMNAK